MKKLLFLALGLWLAAFSYAQFDPGDFGIPDGPAPEGLEPEPPAVIPEEGTGDIVTPIASEEDAGRGTITSICSPGAIDSIQGFVYPVVLMAAAFTALVIGLSYMFGEVLHNPKLTLWAKTEAVQLVISIVATVLILQSISAFCAINLRDVAALFNIPGTELPYGAPIPLLDAAEDYLIESGTFINDVMAAARYHLGAYNIFEAYGEWRCGDAEGGVNIIYCVFGNALGLGSGGGVSIAPASGYALAAPALQLAFNSLIFARLSVLNYLFILRYIYSGFILFFLPLGIFMRAMPYLRTLGSLLMSVALVFMIIYPLTLSVFYLDFLRGNDSVLKPTLSGEGADYPDVGWYARHDVGDQVTTGDVFNVDYDVYDDVLEKRDNGFYILRLTGNAFLIGVFIPTLSLLAAAAAISYINRFLGEEIDLSRVMQMV